MPEGTQTPDNKPEIARLFFALWPDGRVRSRLEQAGKKLHAACGGRITRAETLHLTLVFLGDVEVSKIGALQSVAAEVRAPAFVMLLTRFGWWRHNRVAWAAPENAVPALAQLVDELQAVLQQAEFKLDRRPYAPHLTLLRKARCDRAELPPLAPVEWAVDDFVLVRSVTTTEGAAYEILGRWPLD
jgi:2'-5' RNA ligase